MIISFIDDKYFLIIYFIKKTLFFYKYFCSKIKQLGYIIFITFKFKKVNFGEIVVIPKNLNKCNFLLKIHLNLKIR
jgi:hypothetical protein